MSLSALIEQRAKAHRVAVDALALAPQTAESKQVFTRAMADVDRLGELIAREESRGSSSSFGTNGERDQNPEATIAFMNWMRGRNLNDSEQRAMNSLSERRDVAEGNTLAHIGAYSGLGFFVPTGFNKYIEDATKWYAPLMNGDVFTLWKTETGNPIPFPISNDTNKAAVLVSENTTVTTSSVVEPTADQINFGAYKFSSGEIKCSIELLQDAGFDLESWFAKRFGERFGRAMESYLTNGTGIAQPTGLLTAVAASGATPVSAEGASENTGGSQTGANSIGSSDLINLEHSVDPSYRRNARYMFHDTTCSAIKRILDKYGRPLWQPGIAAGQPDTINGYKYTINQAMPEIGASNVTVAFGDFSKYVVRLVKNNTMIRLTERFADVGQVAFISFSRVDGNLLDAGTHPVNVLQQSS